MRVAFPIILLILALVHPCPAAEKPPPPSGILPFNSPKPSKILSPQQAAYHSRLLQLTGQRWGLYASRLPANTPTGRVVMRVRIKRDGAVEDIVCLQGRENKALAAAAKKMLKDLNGSFDPFPPELRAQVGDWIEEKLTFHHYNPTRLNSGS